MSAEDRVAGPAGPPGSTTAGAAELPSAPGAGSTGIVRHSVMLDPERCIGCTICIKKCPTEAIRVRKGRAHIIDQRCIDCGECIRTCPQGAKKTVSDPLSAIGAYDLRIALPAPSLYAQFGNSPSRDSVLRAILDLGFHGVYEVARAAEIVTEETRRLLALPGPRPLVSSACPAVVRLVRLRFPSLIPQLVPVLPPMEIAARIAKSAVSAPGKRVGAFFISPCAGKVTAVRSPIGYGASAVDGVIAIKDVYLAMRRSLERSPEEGNGFTGLDPAGRRGIEWARAGGEAGALGIGNVVTVDGIANVASLLEELENGNLGEIDYVEALGCPAGCVGGPMAVGNPFLAKTRIDRCGREVDAAGCERAARGVMAGRSMADEGGGGGIRVPEEGTAGIDMGFSCPVVEMPILSLDRDLLAAMAKAERMGEIAESLPGLDCGACGAPSCRALAEDIVRGEASLTDCIFKLRENVRKLAGELLALETIQPPGLDR